MSQGEGCKLNLWSEGQQGEWEGLKEKGSGSTTGQRCRGCGGRRSCTGSSSWPSSASVARTVSEVFQHLQFVPLHSNIMQPMQHACTWLTWVMSDRAALLVTLPAPACMLWFNLIWTHIYSFLVVSTIVFLLGEVTAIIASYFFLIHFTL
jgi:hypothetical protein